MGCCFSSQTSSSPYSSAHHDASSSSARAITSTSQPALPPTRPCTNHSASGDDTRRPPTPNHPAARLRARMHSQLSEHYNAPLRRHLWHTGPRDPSWTRATLDRERDAFFDTRVSGRAEIWQSLRAALELLWAETITSSQPGLPDLTGVVRVVAAGDDDDDEDDDDDPFDPETVMTENLATAQSILDAADVTIPTGDLASGAYDAWGNLYQLPEHIVADPQNLALSPPPSDTSEDDDDDKHAHGAAPDDDDADDASASSTSSELARRREEKGKTVLRRLPGTTVKVTFRLSERGGRDIDVEVGKTDSVRLVGRILREEAGIPNTKRLRIAYLGHFLKENDSLMAQGWTDGHLVNAFVY